MAHKNVLALIMQAKYDDAAEEASNSRWNSKTQEQVMDLQKGLRALSPPFGVPGTGGIETGMEKAAMRLMLGKAKRGPLHCAVGLSADGRLGLLLMHRSRKPRSLARDLKSATPGAKSVRWGTVEVKWNDNGDEKGRTVQFQLNKPLSNIGRRLRKTLAGTGFSKIRMVEETWPPGGTATNTRMHVA